MLTRRQHLLLTYLRARFAQGGAAPSFSEMAQAMSLRSKSGLYPLITALEGRGYIRRLPRRARAIEVIGAPSDAAATLIADVLYGRAAELVEQVQPGWCGRARALLGIKHMKASLAAVLPSALALLSAAA